MSMIRKFTSSVGMLLPVYYDFLSPGEKVNYSCEMFTRTQPLTSPAFVKFTNHVDWFFVPTNQLYQFFGDRQFGINDLKTNLVVQSNVTRDVPLAAVSDISAVVNSNKNTPASDSNTGINTYNGNLRLLDLLGLFRANVQTATLSEQKVNTLLLQAYQKIYSDVYRISDRQSALTYVYNLDSFSNSDVAVATLRELLTLRTRPWKKDLFTNLFPAPLINGGSTGMFSNSALQNVNDWLSVHTSNYSGAQPTIVDNKTVGGSITGTATTTTTVAGVSSALQNIVSTSNIRSMFAIEKLAEITRRAPKHYDAQVLAHFGFDVPVGISGEVYRLGSDSSVFQIGEVTSTTDSLLPDSSDPTKTTGQPLGEMAGKGVSYSQGGKKSFTAPCHGVLMAIYSCIPEADYDNSGLDRLNTYSKREDFYQPEFDRLGMQPAFFYQRYWTTNDPTTDAQIMGWQYRYSELKQKFNIANGGFGLNGTLRNWTTKRSQSPSGLLKDFLIPVNYLDSIMSVVYDNTVNSDFSTDPLLNMFQFNVVKFSQMSTYGLPNL